MKRRYIAVILAAAMLSLTACGSKDTASSDTAAEETAEETTEEAAEETQEEGAISSQPVSYADLTSTITSLGQYKGLELERTVAEVTDADVRREIREVKKEYAELVEVDRPAEEGDVVLIDYTGYVDGETSDSLQGTEFSLELGSGTFIPGFEEGLIGASADEDRELNLTFPEEYYEEMAGKDVTFEVHVQSVSTYVVEDWSDDFIKENVGYENEEEMASSIRADLESDAEAAADENFEYQLLLAILDDSEFEIQDADTDAYTNEMLSEYQTYATLYGVDLGTFLEAYLGVTEEGLRELYYDTAVFRVKMVLALQEIASAEGITVSDEECEEKLQSLADEYGYEDVSAVEAVYSKDMIREQMLQERALNLIVENAVVL